MRMRWAPILILLLAAAILAYGLWDQGRAPPRVLSEGKATVADRRTGAQMALRTRVVQAGSVTRTEIQLPGGTWIDCAGDCPDAVRKMSLELWDELQRKSR